jgi:hypothetical protein
MDITEYTIRVYTTEPEVINVDRTSRKFRVVEG